MSTKKRNSDRKLLTSQAEALLSYDNTMLSTVRPSQWAEEKRFMTTDVSNFPGKFNYDRTPYLREVVDCLMPDHPSREIAVMKGAQIGFSTGVIENGIGWLISEHPCNIMLAARDDDLVKDMMNRKVDQMINSCGLRDYMRANNVRAKNQRTGDTSTGKEFSGGSLRAFSIQNPGRMRQISVQVGFLDDFEAAPADKNAGSAAPLFRTRFKSYGDSKKIFWISTPEIKHTSNIEPLYLRGDQRKYHVPCPCCGDYISLEWRTTGTNGKRAGMFWELDGDKKLIEESVGYICQSCGQFFTEGHKYDMNLAGQWMPTAKADDPTFYSYQISALYAPPGMDDWTHYVREYLDCCPPGGQIKTEDYKVFINTCLGHTWEVKGKTLKVNRLAQNTRMYPIGTVPNQLSLDEGNGNIVMLTVGVDLNGVEDDARIDYEIVAWSESGASYSIDHGSVGTFIPRENTKKVKVDRERWSYVPYADRNVWDRFTKILQQTFPSDDDSNTLFRVSVVGIDTGTQTQYAYDYVEKLNKLKLFTVGLKGHNVNAFRKIDANTRCYTKSRERSDLYMVQVNQIKDELSGKINLRWIEDDGSVQPNGFMNFPAPGPGKYTMKDYFVHYEAEHRVLKHDTAGKEVGYVWERKHSNLINTYWDTRIYNEAVKEILMDAICKEYGIKDPTWKEYCKAILGIK